MEIDTLTRSKLQYFQGYTPHIARDAIPHGFPNPVFPAFQSVAMHIHFAP